MSPAQRGAGMCESQLLSFANPGEFLLDARSIIFPLLLEWLFPEVWYHLPSPKWVERGGKETYKSQSYQTLQIPAGPLCCFLPCLQTPQAGLDSGVQYRGFRVPAGAHQILNIPLGMSRALTSLDLPVAPRRSSYVNRVF